MGSESNEARRSNYFPKWTLQLPGIYILFGVLNRRFLTEDKWSYSIAAMKRQRLISKGALSRLFQEAAEAWRKQNYTESIGLLERATRMDPGNATVLFDLGRAYGMRYDYGSA